MIRAVRVGCALALAGAGTLGLLAHSGRAAPHDVGAVPLAGTTPAASSTPHDLVSTHSARLQDLAATSARVPVLLRIPALGIVAPVLGVGVAADGQLAVPNDLRRVGWYGAGTLPGDPGSALIAAHVDHGSSPGVFFSLDSLAPGAAVQIVQADGRLINFRVVARRLVAKPTLPVSQLTATTGPARLVLVTCGGSFDRGRRSYRDNLLVYAVPV